MLRRYWTLILLVLAPLVALWRPVFLGETIGPVDQIQQMAPWHAAKPEQPWDVLQADGVLQFLPWRDLVFKSWAQGRLPAWNPYELAGTPLLANSQSGALYPPHILVGLFHLPTPLGLALLAWLHLFLAGFGAASLCRRLGGTEIGGLIAGLSFSLSAFMLSWTALPSVIETVAWIPWALVAVTHLLDGDAPKGRAKALVGLAAAVGMMALAGHLQFAAYGATAVVVFAIGRAVAHQPKSSLRANIIGVGLVFGGLAAGFALAAPQLLPVLEFSQSSHRRNVPTEDGYAAYSQNSIRLWELGGAIYPKLNGDPTASVDLSGQAVSSYWPNYVRPGANFAESAIALGPLVLCLLMCARRKAPYWRELSPLVVGGFLALLLALGTAANRLLYFLLPGWSSTGSPGRASVIFVLAGCVAAGVVASQPVEAREKKRRLYAPVAAFLVLTLGSVYFVLYGLRGMQPSVFDADTLTSIISAATKMPVIEAILAGIVTCAAVALWIRSGRTRAAWLLAPIALTPILVLPPLVRSGSGGFEVKGHPDGRIAVVNDHWSLFQAPQAFLPPNTGMMSGFRDLGGYDSLLDKDTKAMLDDANGQNSTPPENGNMMFVKSTADPAKLAAAGVIELWTSKEMPELGQPVSSEEMLKGESYLRRYRLPGPGLISAPTKFEVTDNSPGHFEATADGPGSFIVRDRNLPGWTANVDGQPAASNGFWHQVELGPGSHRVEFSYSPPGLRTGSILALATALLLGLAWFVVSRRRAVVVE